MQTKRKREDVPTDREKKVLHAVCKRPDLPSGDCTNDAVLAVAQEELLGYIASPDVVQLIKDYAACHHDRVFDFRWTDESSFPLPSASGMVVVKDEESTAAIVTRFHSSYLFRFFMGRKCTLTFPHQTQPGQSKQKSFEGIPGPMSHWTEVINPYAHLEREYGRRSVVISLHPSEIHVSIPCRHAVLVSNSGDSRLFTTELSVCDMTTQFDLDFVYHTTREHTPPQLQYLYKTPNGRDSDGPQKKWRVIAQADRPHEFISLGEGRLPCHVSEAFGYSLHRALKLFGGSKEHRERLAIIEKVKEWACRCLVCHQTHIQLKSVAPHAFSFSGLPILYWPKTCAACL
jgi:hypothetical protein